VPIAAGYAQALQSASSRSAKIGDAAVRGALAGEQPPKIGRAPPLLLAGQDGRPERRHSPAEPTARHTPSTLQHCRAQGFQFISARRSVCVGLSRGV
jgi:hypothetical protein